MKDALNKACINKNKQKRYILVISMDMAFLYEWSLLVSRLIL